MNRVARFRFLGAAMVGAYLVINLLMFLLRPVVEGMHPFASTALLVPPMVLAMVYVVIPVAKRA
jgi:antibiotic biosynthesis monooxygenase (ABM) superfamily enzyme